MPLLAVKLDSATWLREGKRDKSPDPAQLAVLAEQGGADAIVAQLTTSRRHIRERDIFILKEVVKTRFIVETQPDENLLQIVLEARPYMVTFVSENQMDSNIREPLDYGIAADRLAEATERLRGAGVISSHLIRPQPEAVKNAARAKAEFVEICTSELMNAASTGEAEAQLGDIDRAGQLAGKLGMGVNCGGGLGYKNARSIAEIQLVQQIVIGRAIIKRAMLVGIERAVSQMREEITRRV